MNTDHQQFWNLFWEFVSSGIGIICIASFLIGCLFLISVFHAPLARIMEPPRLLIMSVLVVIVVGYVIYDLSPLLAYFKVHKEIIITAKPVNDVPATVLKNVRMWPAGGGMINFKSEDFRGAFNEKYNTITVKD